MTKLMPNLSDEQQAFLESPPKILFMAYNTDSRYLLEYLQQNNYIISSKNSLGQVVDVIKKTSGSHAENTTNSITRNAPVSLADSKFDLVLISCGEIIIDPQHLVYAAQSSDYQIPVVLLVPNITTEHKIDLLRLGITDLIVKPLHFDELILRLKQHIAASRLQKMVLNYSYLLKERNSVFLSDLRMAWRTQRALLPQALPATNLYKTCAQYLPAEKLGGDLYDVVVMDGGEKIGLLIVDVCGHGVHAAFVTLMTKLVFRNAIANHKSPAHVLNAMNKDLCKLLNDTYVTAFYCVYDSSDGTLIYASGGHQPLLVCRPSKQECLTLLPQEPFLGSYYDIKFISDTIRLMPDDRLLMFTDGLVECRNAGDEEYGTSRLEKFLLTNAREDFDKVISKLIYDVQSFAGQTTIRDDITVLGMHVL